MVGYAWLGCGVLSFLTVIFSGALLLGFDISFSFGFRDHGWDRIGWHTGEAFSGEKERKKDKDHSHCFPLSFLTFSFVLITGFPFYVSFLITFLG